MPQCKRSRSRPQRKGNMEPRPGQSSLSSGFIQLPSEGWMFTHSNQKNN